MHNKAPTDVRNPDFLDKLINFKPSGSSGRIISKHLAGKRILVTGAGGSIGSALVHAIWASTPARLILLDTSENGLYQIDRDLKEAGSYQHISFLGSVCDHDTLSHVFDQHQPQIVFHAAALKHVPLMEQNPFAAIENNALGTLTLAKATIAHHAEQLILVSTDKAVDPVSIMGASKRIAELILLTLDTISTRMTAVRLCNVIGSQGSVLPLFLDQIARCGPLTVTHPDAHRYFITLDRAVNAIFAALQSQSNHALLLPNFDAPVRILDLAHHLLQTHASSAAIEYIGLRPGDKITELLLSNREGLASNLTTGVSTLRAIETPMPSPSTFYAALSELREATQSRDLSRLLRAVFVFVPEYQPSSVIAAALPENLALHLAPEMHV